MATMTEAEKIVAAAERAERAQRIAKEQRKLDTERAEQERETKNRRAAEAREHREREHREQFTPFIPFEHNGYRTVVVLGSPDPARRQMAAHACRVLGNYVQNMFVDQTLRYALTGEKPPMFDWASAVLNGGELYEAARHGVVYAEKVPE